LKIAVKKYHLTQDLLKGKTTNTILETEDLEEINKQMKIFIERKQEDKKAFSALVIKKIGMIAETNDMLKNIFKEKEQAY